MKLLKLRRSNSFSMRQSQASNATDMAKIHHFAADQLFSAVQHDGSIYTSARHLHRRDSVMTTITVATYRALGEMPRMDKIRILGAVLALVLAEHDDTQ